MQPPFGNNLKDVADSMGIALYQRFTLNEASLFLRCPESDIKRLVSGNNIDHIKITKKQTEFFGYQLLAYLLSKTTGNASPIRSNKTNTDHIIRAKEVQSMTGLSRTTLWRMENKGEFPRRVSLGVGSVGWRHSEVQQWLANRQAV